MESLKKMTAAQYEEQTSAAEQLRGLKRRKTCLHPFSRSTAVFTGIETLLHWERIDRNRCQYLTGGLSCQAVSMAGCGARTSISSFIEEAIEEASPRPVRRPMALEVVVQPRPERWRKRNRE